MIAILKYNAGNATSVHNALNRLGFENCITDDIDMIGNADKVIFPGVGEASSAMKYLKEKGLDKIIPKLSQPVLGICLGLQLMCNDSEEGNTTCMGIFNTSVKKFPDTNIVPHLGWNNCEYNQYSSIMDNNYSDNYFFVHSYYAELCANTVAICDYILPFSAVLQKGNFYATQFHPEKSSTIGEKLLKNFLTL